MSCAHPWIRKNEESRWIPYWQYNRLYIPCGRCLNCRIDKQNELTDRCEQELIDFKCGAFVTVTYDDYHLEEFLRRDINGNLNATLSRKDCKKFIDRLRGNVKNCMPDNLLSNHHFKYVAVGEYGGDGQVFDRPHMHFLFFGLDFAVCKRMFEKSWQSKGIIEVDPILQGGIHYVLKYLDKQLFGEQAEIKYDNNNIERPFQCHSLGLGSNLYKNQKEYIRKTNGSYRWKGKDRPCPTYYKNKYLLPTDHWKSVQSAKDSFKLHNGYFPKTPYDLHDFQIRQAEIKEANANIRLQQSGRPKYDYMSLNDLHYVSQVYISELVSNALLSQKYIDSA